MKSFTHLIILILSIPMLFVSCQKEESEFINDTPDQTITANSELAKLLLNTSQNSGAIDDFIDGNACSSIQFPYQVIVNGQTLTLENEDDVIALSIANANITIVFPVTVIFEDFSTAVINDQQELNALGDVCDSIDEAINCIDLVYPVTFFTYNADNEQTGTVVIDNDAELFAFLFSLDEGTYVALDFPISVVLAGGNTIPVNNNAQLQGLIQNCTDPTTGPPSPLDLENVLTTDSWFVSFYFDDEDETYEFEGYEFFFNTDGSASATNGSNTENGTWSVATSSGNQLKLILDFGNDDPFDELEDDWKVIEFNEEIIRLLDISGGGGSTDFLTFSRTPSTGGGGGAQGQELRDTLEDGDWFVALYIEDGEDDETSNFNSFTFDFEENGVLVASNTSGSYNGTWFVTGSDDNLEVILDFDSVYPLEDLDDDWMVFSFSENQVQLRDDDDSDASILTFEKF